MSRLTYGIDEGEQLAAFPMPKHFLDGETELTRSGVVYGHRVRCHCGTVFLRIDGVAEPGEDRNVPARARAIYAFDRHALENERDGYLQAAAE